MTEPTSPAVEAVFSFFGSVVVTLAAEPAARDNARRLSQLWRPFRHENAEDATVQVTVFPGPEGLAAAAGALNTLAVAECPLPAVHASVVTTAEGAVALPAPSGFGKSTFAAAACRAGAGYLSDEALVLAAGPELAPESALTGRVELAALAPMVLPYPKPLALSQWSLAACGLAERAGAGAGAGSGAGAGAGAGTSQEGETLLFGGEVGELAAATPLGHVLLPQRHDGTPRLTTLSRSEGLAELLRLSFNHHRAPRRFLVTAAGALQGARVHRLLVGHPVETARLVVDTFGAPEPWPTAADRPLGRAAAPG